MAIVEQDARRYVALKVLKVGPDQWRDRGEPVPEANDWHPNAVAALLHTGQLGEGPVCEHEADMADLRARIDALAGQLAALQTERDTLRDQRDAARAEAKALQQPVSASGRPYVPKEGK